MTEGLSIPVEGGMPAEDLTGLLQKIRDAFGVFDAQSQTLRASYERIQRDLAKTNRELQEKNRALSAKMLELEAMSGRLQCILESLTDGILVVDPQLCIERCNLAAERLLGKDRHNLAGRPYAEVVNGLGDVEKLRAAIQNGTLIAGQERRASSAQGEERIVLASVAPIRNPDGRILGAVEVLRDITEFRRLQVGMEQQRQLATLGHMAAYVAHEMRNPLGGIEGFARLLKRELTDRPEPLRLACRILEGVEHMHRVVTELLVLARPVHPVPMRFPAARLLCDVRDLLLALATPRSVRLTVDVGEETSAVTGDLHQLRQVLLNLGRNAVEACEPGGQVTLSFFREKGVAVFAVTDTGCGISDDDRKRLFEPFFTRKSGGTGLGLSLCQKIVLAHGGHIRVTSRVGQGSRFDIVLPEEVARP